MYTYGKTGYILLINASIIDTVYRLCSAYSDAKLLSNNHNPTAAPAVCSPRCYSCSVPQISLITGCYQ